jgi:hypothetical protein
MAISTLIAPTEGAKAVLNSTRAETEAAVTPLTSLGLPEVGDSEDVYNSNLAKLQSMTTDANGTTVTDAQISQAMWSLKTSKMSQFEASAEQNINIFSNMMNRAYDNIVDEEWEAGGSSDWLARNKPYMSEEAYNDYSANPRSNRDDARLFLDRYSRESALGARVYRDGFWGGLGTDLVTSLASPQDLPLYAIPFLGWGAKGARLIDKIVDSSSKWQALGNAGLLGSATALYSEGTRQKLAGIDLDDEYMVAGLGFFFGGTLEGISQGWARMSGKEKEIFTQKVNTFGEGLRELSAIPVTKEPKGVPVDISSVRALEIPFISERVGEKGTTSIRYNPNPIQRLYGVGVQEVYDITSKFKSSVTTLVDPVTGERVVQTGKNAYELRTKHIGVGDTYQGKMLNLEKRAKKEFKMSKQEFSDNVHKASTDVDLAHRKVKVEKAYYNEQIAEIKIIIDELEVTIKDKNSAEWDVEEAADALEVYKSDLATAEEELSQVAEAIIPEIENPLIKAAVAEKHVLYKHFNDTKHRIEVDELAADWATKKANMKARIDSKIRDAEEMPDIDYEKFDISIAKMEAKIVDAEVAYKTDLANLNARYKDGELGYSPRYWLADEMAREGDHVEIIGEAILNGPQAKLLEKKDPEAYEELVDSIDEVAESIIGKVRDSKDVNANRDIAGLRPEAKSKGNTFRAKSETARTADVDENLVDNLIQRHWNDVTMAYVHDMSHKLSTREALGVRTSTEFYEKYLVDLNKSLRRAGLTEDEITSVSDDLRDMAKESLGTRSKLKAPNDVEQRVKRAFMDFNNMRLGMGFLKAQLSEMGPATKVAGVRYFKELGPALAKTMKDYRGGVFDETDLDVFKALGMGSTLQKSGMSSRFEDGRVTGGQSGLLHKGANASMHAGGMMALLNASRLAVPKGYMFRVHRIATRMAEGDKTLSAAETKQFARWGLAPEDFLKISQQKLKHEDGTRNLSLEGWPEDVKELFQRSIIRATREAILDPTGYDIPKRMSDVNDAQVPMITQYLRFPTASYNTLYRNGMADHDARTVAALGVSLASVALYDYGIDKAEVYLGFKDESDYETDSKGNLTDEGAELLMTKSMLYNPFSSSFGKVLDILGAGTQQSLPGSEGYVRSLPAVLAGPSGGTAGNFLEFLYGVAADREFNKAGQSLIPGGSLPIMGEGIKKGVEFVAEEYVDPTLEVVGDSYDDIVD